MPELEALYRCVCGTNVPFQTGKSGVFACPSCGRQHRILPEETSTAETLFLSAAKLAGARGAPGAPGAVAEKERPSLVGRAIDHFEVIEELGRGGMGTVYRALDRSLERYVALKVLNSEEALKQKDLVEAFTHEARTQARVNHPGVTTIYYVGRFENMTYFAMEIVPGENLEAKVRDGPLPFRDVISTGIQVVQALREARERGVIHRDIKPGNIILSSSGRVKITDFGLSKTEKGGLQITGARHITGTPYYIAPEQAKGESTDFRTDIYSLGATLYHLAYGRPPFDGDNFMAVISKHLSEPVKCPESPPRDVPPGFPVLIERMMAKDPAERFESYDGLERALFSLRPEAQKVAALGRRASAAILDFAAVILIQGFLFGVLHLVTETREGQLVFGGSVVGGVSALAIAVQTWLGTSLGKIFGKIRIARIDGRRIQRWRLAGRGILQYLPFIAGGALNLAGAAGLYWHRKNWIAFLVLGVFALDHLWALTNRNRRTLHDLACGTWVLDNV